MRTLNSKEQGELDFWIDYVNGGCEDETGRSFATEFSEGAKGRLEYYFKNIPEPVPTAGHVWVDVGTGPYSVLLAAPAGVTRIMIDPLMKHYAHHSLLQPVVDSSKDVYVESFGEDLPLLNESAHLVFCTNTIDHVNQPFETMRELVRILKPDGYLVIEMDTGGITDEMHPHALTIEQVHGYFREFGMSIVFEHVPTGGKRRPGARLLYGIYRRTPEASQHFPKAPPSERKYRPILAEEGFHGFNVIRYGNTFYGLSQNDGVFSYARVQERTYSIVFEGQSVAEVKRAISKHVEGE